MGSRHCGPLFVACEQLVRRVLRSLLVHASCGYQCLRTTLDGENYWIKCPYILIGNVWRALREQKGLASMLIPLWESAPWWQLVCRYAPTSSTSLTTLLIECGCLETTRPSSWPALPRAEASCPPIGRSWQSVWILGSFGPSPLLTKR